VSAKTALLELSLPLAAVAFGMTAFCDRGAHGRLRRRLCCS
jgi:hypothetical protein